MRFINSNFIYINKGLSYLKKKGFKRFVFRTLEKISDKTESRYKKYRVLNMPSQKHINAQKCYKFDYEPIISIVVPVYNTPQKIFISMLESVINQTYPNWELCIANGSTEKRIDELLCHYIKKDSRIKVIALKQNMGISRNTNKALELATGEYIGLLDHDDILEVNALFEVVKYVNDNNYMDIIYSDEDKISEDGMHYFEPHFKPDWSPDLLRSYNYMCHFLVFKRALLEKVGFFRENFDGSQDYDFILRLTEATDDIGHICKILYHWRINPGSTAGDITRKEYAISAGKKALEEHLQRKKLCGSVTYGDLLGSYVIRYDINKDYKVSIIIYNEHFQMKLIKKVVNKLLRHCGYENYEVIVISSDSTLASNSEVKFLNFKDHNYAKAINYAVSKATGDMIVLLNANMHINTHNWLKLLVSYMTNEEIGVVGVKILKNRFQIKNAGFKLDKDKIIKPVYAESNKNYFGYMGRLKVIQNLNIVSESCVVFKRDVFNKTTGLDESYYGKLAFADFCLKVQQNGKFIVWTPFVEIIESCKFGNFHSKDIKLFKNHWNIEVFCEDPFVRKI